MEAEKVDPALFGSDLPLARSNTHGSARFEEFGLLPADELEKNEIWKAVFFGHCVYEGKKHYKAAQPKRHFLTVAPTRSGKGVSVIIPNLLRYRGNCIVIDPKGENAWLTAKYRREVMKQKTIILDPWGEVNRRYGAAAGELETVARFNPLSILDPASEHYADDIAYIADALIISQGKDPHWDDSARELVAGLIAYCVESFGDAASLPMVRLLLSKPADEVAGVALDAQKFGHESVAARKLGRFARDSKEVASIVSTALTQTAFLDSAQLGESLSHSDFEIEDITRGPCSIFWFCPLINSTHTGDGCGFSCRSASAPWRGQLPAFLSLCFSSSMSLEPSGGFLLSLKPSASWLACKCAFGPLCKTSCSSSAIIPTIGKPLSETARP